MPGGNIKTWPDLFRYIDTIGRHTHLRSGQRPASLGNCDMHNLRWSTPRRFSIPPRWAAGGALSREGVPVTRFRSPQNEIVLEHHAQNNGTLHFPAPLKNPVDANLRGFRMRGPTPEHATSQLAPPGFSHSYY